MARANPLAASSTAGSRRASTSYSPVLPQLARTPRSRSACRAAGRHHRQARQRPASSRRRGNRRAPTQAAPASRTRRDRHQRRRVRVHVAAAPRQHQLLLLDPSHPARRRRTVGQREVGVVFPAAPVHRSAAHRAARGTTDCVALGAREPRAVAPRHRAVLPLYHAPTGCTHLPHYEHQHRAVAHRKAAHQERLPECRTPRDQRAVVVLQRARYQLRRARRTRIHHHDDRIPALRAPERPLYPPCVDDLLLPPARRVRPRFCAAGTRRRPTPLRPRSPRRCLAGRAAAGACLPSRAGRALSAGRRRPSRP